MVGRLMAPGHGPVCERAGWAHRGTDRIDPTREGADPAIPDEHTGGGQRIRTRRLLTLMVGCMMLVSGVLGGAPGRAEVSLVTDGLDPGENRVALVIGNSAYPTGALTNPTNDALDMASALSRVGFEVTTLIDASHRDIRRAYIDFGRRLSDGGVGLFYYAGHGVQVNGENYLIPVDAVIEDEAHVEVEGVNINEILARMGGARNRLNIVILDACRDNPFRSVMRSSGPRGLARTSAPTGTYLAYATAPDQVALDGESRSNSPFTAALVEAMEEPGHDLDDVFLEVRRAVLDETDGKQVPWVSTSVTGHFYFRPPEGTRTEVATATAPRTRSLELSAPSIPNAPEPGTSEEALFWQSIMNSDEPALYREYLSRWPDGTYAPIAEVRLEQLESQSAETPSATTPPATTAPTTPPPAGTPPASARPEVPPPAVATPPTSTPPATPPQTSTTRRSGVPPAPVPFGGTSPSTSGSGPDPVATVPSTGLSPPPPRPLGADGSNNPDAMDTAGRTSLMLAARDDDQRRIRTLLNAGAAVDRRARDGHTALTLAAQNGHVESARMLIRAGADLTIEGPTGPAWQTLARVPGGEALLQDEADVLPEVGEALLDPGRAEWREVQARLNALGHSAGAVDGVPGSQTRNALQAFQSAQSLHATGYLTEASLTRLRAVSPAIQIPAEPAPPRRAAPSPAPEPSATLTTTLVLCQSVNAALGGGGADIANPLKVTLDDPMEVDRVEVDAHDDVGFFTNAVLNLYIDDDFIGRRDVKSAGSVLTYSAGRTGRVLEFYSREEDGLTGDEETFIRTIKIYAKRPVGTPDAACP